MSLELPVFHVGYIKAIYNILQKICKVNDMMQRCNSAVVRATAAQ